MELRRHFPSEDLRFDPKFRIGNCYTYALNINGLIGVSPGALKNPDRPLLGKENIYPDALNTKLLIDGLLPVANCSEDFNRNFIAAFISPGHDFHFYRRHSTGGWSHKIGRNYPSCFDHNEHLIEDPREASRGRYSEFVGLYELPADGIQYVIGD